jgi:NADH-quinone oxidoreductase subunit F
MKRTVKMMTSRFRDGSIEHYDFKFLALKKAFDKTKGELIEEITLSGLKGRGGAAYPVGKKLTQSSQVISDIKYLICNADEGEPGTFKDRDLLQYDPTGVFEGMLIAAYAVDATHGYLYLREEYSYLTDKLEETLAMMREKNFLGNNILSTDFSFDIEIFIGAGAYICGEGTSLIESIEGKPGRPRIKPPYTKQQGLFMQPTLVHNVETLSVISTVVREGYESIIKYGTEKSPGTKLISLCGNVNKSGTYEIPFGVTLQDIVFEIGGGIRDDNEVKFLQIGGISGPILPAKHLVTKYTYEDLEKMDISMGSGAIVVADDKNSIIDFLESVQMFFLHESCGKCTPCREGNRQLMNIIRRIKAGKSNEHDSVNIKKIAHTMKYASFCGLGQTAPTALLSALEYYPEELFMRRGDNE